MDIIQQIAKFTQELLEQMGISAEVEITMQESSESDSRDVYHIEITGDNLGLLIGYKGENLDSIETVIAMIVNNQREPRVRVVLDIGQWRKDRYVQIERIVVNAISQIEESGDDAISLPPMKPHERRKAHEIITSRGYLSESAGYEPNRKIIIRKAQ